MLGGKQGSMPQIDEDYERYYKKPRKVGKFFKKVFVLLLGCVVLFSTYLVADTLSDWMTNSGSGHSWWMFWKKDVKQSKTVLYGVSLGEYDDQTKAEEIARNSNVAGAGGYVYSSGGKFYVIGNVYRKIEEAQSVIEGISDANYVTSIVELEIPKIKSSYEGALDIDIALIKEGLALLDTTYDKLYSVSLMLDTKQMTHIQASTEISSLATQWTVLQTKLENQIANHLCNATIIFKTRLVEIESNLNDLSDKLLSNTGTVYVTKYATIRHVVLWQSVAKNMG